MSNRTGKKRGRIFVISSPSGGGKTSVCNALRKERFNVEYSVSATTRPPRPGERDGEDYHFLDRAGFMRLVRRNAFLEWTDNFGNLYGTPKSPVEDTLAGGEDIILSIDVKGAMQVKKAHKDALLIFLMPPSMELLKRRLKERNTEKKKRLAERLKAAKKELRCRNKYDYTVLNDRLPDAVNVIKSIIIAERHKIR